MSIKNQIKEALKKTFVYKHRMKRLRKKREKQVEYLRSHFLAENTDLLHAFCDALNNAGIVFWLEFGTLLGYYREHDFIAHDMDIDIGTYWKNVEAVQRALENAGFKLVREYKVLDDGGIEQCYLYKHSTIDVFYFRQDGNTLYCNTFCSYDNKMDLSKRKYIDKPCPVRVRKINVPLMKYVPATFKGCSVYVPENTDKYLRVHYGSGYMTPNPNFDRKKESTNITYYEYNEKKGVAYFKLPYFGHPEDYGLI